MENKTESLWDQLRDLCLTQALKSIETEGTHIPTPTCAEIAVRLANTASAIDRRNCQSDGLEEIKKLNHFYDFIKRS